MSLYYEPIYEDTDTKYGHLTRLVRIVPKEGMWLFEIQATYAKRVPSTTYYILALNKSHAVKRLKSILTWLDVTSVRKIPPGDEAEDILTDPLKMPLL